MISGLLIKQSLINLQILDLVHMTKEDSWTIDDAAEGQDKVWDIVYFEFEDKLIDQICDIFSTSLKEGKWFVDFRDTDNVYVVFKGKIFKYPKGNKSLRKEVENYALSIGIPETQLGWED